MFTTGVVIHSFIKLKILWSKSMEVLTFSHTLNSHFGGKEKTDGMALQKLAQYNSSLMSVAYALICEKEKVETVLLVIAVNHFLFHLLSFFQSHFSNIFFRCLCNL